MRTLLAVVVLAPVVALAQPVEQGPEGQASQSRPYWDGCRDIWVRAPYVHYGPTFYGSSVIVPSPSPGGSGSATPSGGGSGGGGRGSSFNVGGAKPEALLVLAVVALAVLPIVVYAIDSPADELTLDRFYCPSLSFNALGGVQVPTTGVGNQPFALGVAKLRADVGYVGVMAELGLAPAGSSVTAGFSAHFLVRAPPKAHLEGAIALGGRRAIGPNSTLDGFEIALPHTYVFHRDGYKKLGLEVMPRVFFNRRAIDVGADIAFVAPLADVLQVRVGVGAFSHAGRTQLTASAGLGAQL